MAGEESHAWIWILIVLIALGLAVGGYSWFNQKQSQQPTGLLEKATLGVETSVLSAAVWVAENEGYFQEEGLDLTIIDYESGRLSFLALLKGEGIDICTVAPTPIMFSSFERQDFYLCATFIYSYDDVKLIARKDRGINAAADLKGKRIGTAAGTTGHFFLDSFLIQNGMLPSDVEMIDIGPSALPTALQNNQVDAIAIWEPHAYNAKRSLGKNAIRLPSSEVYRETFNLVAASTFAKDHPEALRSFLRAIDKATEFIRHNKEESQIIVSKRLKLDKGMISAVWDDFVFEISLDQSLLITLEDEARWAIQNKLTDKIKIPDFLDLIYPHALQDVKPEAVTIIR